MDLESVSASEDVIGDPVLHSVPMHCCGTLSEWLRSEVTNLAITINIERKHPVFCRGSLGGET